MKICEARISDTDICGKVAVEVLVPKDKNKRQGWEKVHPHPFCLCGRHAAQVITEEETDFWTTIPLKN